LLLLNVISIANSIAASTSLRVVVATEEGPVAGTVNGTLAYKGLKCMGTPLFDIVPNPPGATDVAAFLGIPYVAAPVGSNRFRPPQPAPKRSQVLEAQMVGAVCPQLPLADLVSVGNFLPADEDCLYLNVWAPSQGNGSISSGLPVLVFFHGGAFLGGSGYQMFGCPLYNAQQLAADIGAIVITVNYRLGALGFTAHAEMMAESGTTGNYGLQDQRAALRWIRSNIVGFGGDPGRVTIMGESAGAVSVLHHMVLPKSDLFSRAISMSGYEVTWSLDRAYTTAEHYIAAAGCDQAASKLECLRAAPLKKLMNAQGKVLFAPEKDLIERAVLYGPVSDGSELPAGKTFEEVFRATKPSKPLLIGSNQNDTNFFTCELLPGKLSWEDATAWLQKKIPEMMPSGKADNETVTKFLQQYSSYSSPREAVKAATTDLMFGCTADMASSVVSAGGKTPVYRYLFSRPPAFFRLDKCFGTPHTAELYLLFAGAFPKQLQGVVVGDAAEQRLAQTMRTAWGRFVRGEDAPIDGWPSISSTDESTLQLGNDKDDSTQLLKNWRKEACSIIRDLPEKDAMAVLV